MSKTKNLGHLRALREDLQRDLDDLRRRLQQASRAADISRRKLRTIRDNKRYWQNLRKQYQQEYKAAESYKAEHWKEYSKARKSLNRKISGLRQELELQNYLKQSALASLEYFSNLARRDIWRGDVEVDFEKARANIAACHQDVTACQVEIEILCDVIRQLTEEITDARKVAEWLTQPSLQRLQDAQRNCHRFRRELGQIEQRHSAEIAEVKSLQAQLEKLETEHRRLCQRISAAEHRQACKTA